MYAILGRTTRVIWGCMSKSNTINCDDIISIEGNGVDVYKTKWIVSGTTCCPLSYNFCPVKNKGIIINLKGSQIVKRSMNSIRSRFSSNSIYCLLNTTVSIPNLKSPCLTELKDVLFFIISEDVKPSTISHSIGQLTLGLKTRTLSKT